MRNDPVSIDSYRGSAEELAEFVNEVWEHSYAGKMPFPHWTPAYLKWQLRIRANEDSRSLLAAYEGMRLVGVLLGTDYSFRTPGGIFRGSQWSRLSVHPEYRGKGIAKALDRERIHRQEAAGSKLVVSYRYVGSRHSQAERPDKNFPAEKFHRKVGSSARVLDPTRFRKWRSNRVHGLLAQLAAPMARVPRPRGNDPQIREFSVSRRGAAPRRRQMITSVCSRSFVFDAPVMLSPVMWPGRYMVTGIPRWRAFWTSFSPTHFVCV